MSLRQPWQLFSLLLLLGLGACGEDPADSPCEGETCSGHGQCQVTEGVPFCECDDGYALDDANVLECVLQATDPCEGETCSGHGQCQVTEGVPFCECEDGYALDDANVLECVPQATDPCEGETCSGHGSCIAEGQLAVCECETGYEGERCDACAVGYVDIGAGVCVDASSGACLGAADIAIIQGGSDPEAAASHCSIGCLSDPDVPGCTIACVETDTGLSPECSRCYAEFVICPIENCPSECMVDPASEGCLACKEDAGCNAAFSLCSGLPEP